MEYVIYMDLVFLTDFFFNFLVLCMTGVLLRMPRSRMRLLFSAVAGSLWNCLLLVRPIRSAGMELLFTVPVAGSFMVWIAFGGAKSTEAEHNGSRMAGGLNLSRWIRRCGFYIKADLALLISSNILGGFLVFAGEQFFLTDEEALMAAGLLTGAAGVFFQEVLKPAKLGKERYQITLFYQGDHREFSALADSGNRLRVPETGKPVALVSYEDLRGFCDRVSGGFYIPYRAVGTEHGLLFAITFEKIEIKKNGMCITIENPAVAITKEPLSTDGDFNMILPEEYVTEISGCRNRRRKSQ